MAENERILIITTSNATLGETGRGTGFHYSEMTTPYWRFIDAGYQVDIASPKGGAAPHDPNSLPEDESEREDSVKRFLADDAAMHKIENTLKLEDVDGGDYVAIYLPGGHGTMWDLPENPSLTTLLAQAYDAGKPVAAVCHGPAGFVGVERSDGQPLVAGKRVNSFTDAEETQAGLTDVVPFLLESRLRELGGEFEGAANFEEKVVRDGNLITGQNPASAAGLAEAVLEAIEEYRNAREAAE